MDLYFDKDILEFLLEVKISNEPENKENYSIHYEIQVLFVQSNDQQLILNHLFH